MALANFFKFLVVLGLCLVSGFFLCVKLTVYDTAELISPSRQKKLAEWEEFCEKDVPVGETYSGVLASLDDRKVQPSDRLTGRFNGTAYTVIDQGKHARVKVVDMNVRSWDPTGDAHIGVFIRVEEGTVSSSHASVHSHGR